MIFVALLLCVIVLGFISWFLESKFYATGLSIISAVMTVVLAIIAIAMGITYLDNYVAYDSHCYEVAATRAMYVDELKKYDEMRDSDVTASSTYLELREKVIDFNGEIEYAKSLNPFWFAYSWYDPAYLTVEPIELGVG